MAGKANCRKRWEYKEITKDEEEHNRTLLDERNIINTPRQRRTAHPRQSLETRPSFKRSYNARLDHSTKTVSDSLVNEGFGAFNTNDLGSHMSVEPIADIQKTTPVQLTSGAEPTPNNAVEKQQAGHSSCSSLSEAQNPLQSTILRNVPNPGQLMRRIGGSTMSQDLGDSDSELSDVDTSIFENKYSLMNLDLPKRENMRQAAHPFSTGPATPYPCTSNPAQHNLALSTALPPTPISMGNSFMSHDVGMEVGETPSRPLGSSGTLAMGYTSAIPSPPDFMDIAVSLNQKMAFELSRSINANRPRRGTANYTTNVYSPKSLDKTRASKRIRLSQTPESLSPRADFEHSSFSNRLSKPTKVVVLKLATSSLQRFLDAQNAMGADQLTHDGESSDNSELIAASQSTIASHSTGDGNFIDASIPSTVCSAGPSRTARVGNLVKTKPRGKAQYQPYHVNVQDQNKHEPFGQPPAWSDKRQGLCETLPWYNAYQSGAYTHDGKALGFMTNKEVTLRDVFDEEIMITACGGGRVSDGTGKMARKKDQDTSSVAAAFETAMRAREPVGVIAGCGNPNSPSRLPHIYNVLDWFQVTDVWPERQEGVKLWMVRLEKINLSVKSWWAAEDSPPLPDNRDLSQFKTVTKKCDLCNKHSKEIYNTGWACLTGGCPGFFEFAHGYDGKTLAYNEQFLNERTKYPKQPGPLTPPLLTDQDLLEMDAFGIEKQCTRGIVCPLCKCCSRRIEWRQWSCENPACNFTYRTTQAPVPINEVLVNCTKPKVEFHAKSIKPVEPKPLDPYILQEYSVPDENGKIIGFIRHFKANGLINKQPDGPNDLFRQMQEREFGMKRNAARQKNLPGEILTAHWAANWGAPYKFGVSVLSKGFDEAPPVILKALKRLTWAGEQTLAENMEPFHPFNELLSLGYFEDSHIGYHDDGEKELGPTIATLSLGASASMTFRPKKRNDVGERASVGRKLKAEGKRDEGNKKIVLRITLNHGDLLVMHGREIQRLYEHAVEPHGKIRFALTCRYIRPETIEDAVERDAAIAKGKIPAEWDQYIYDGDVNAQEIPEQSRLAPNRLDYAKRILADFKAGLLSEEEIREIQQMIENGLLVGPAAALPIVESLVTGLPREKLTAAEQSPLIDEQLPLAAQPSTVVEPSVIASSNVESSAARPSIVD